jgi:preprotein translocase subunit SecE
MSKLQKKKPVSEKKKQRAVSESTTDLSAGPSGFSSPKSTAGAGTIKAKPEKSLTDTKAGEPNIFQRAMVFLREVKMELKKVTWPTRKQTTGTTIVVIIFVFVIAAFLGLFDVGLSKLVQVVLT